MLVTIGLGSCVAIVLYDAAARVGGLAHVLLPSPALSRQDSNPAKFPQTAVPRLLELMAAARREHPARSPRGWSAAPACSPALGAAGHHPDGRAQRGRLAAGAAPARRRRSSARRSGGDFGRTVRLWVADGRVEVSLGGAWCPHPLSRADRPRGRRQPLLPAAADRRGGRQPGSSGWSAPRGTGWTRCGRCTTTRPTWCSWTWRCPSSTASARSATSCPSRRARSWW